MHVIGKTEHCYQTALLESQTWCEVYKTWGKCHINKEQSFVHIDDVK